MARASSGHFAKGGAGYFAHNSRENKTKNSIFSTDKNEVSCNAKQAFEIYRKELSKRAEAYTARTNQKLQKNIATHRSLIINLEKHHTLKDLKPIVEYLEKELDTKVLQVAIHHDEGYIDEVTKEPYINYHAHIELMGIDRYGISIAQHQNKINSKTKIKQTRTSRLDSKFYKEFQTFLAQHLKMKRGNENSKAKRLDTYQYKTAKQNENKTTTPLKLTVKQLKAELEAERKRMAEMKIYTREDYQALSKLKQAANRDNLQDIYFLFLNMKQEHIRQQTLQQTLQQQNETIESKNESLQQQKLQSKNEMLQQQNHNIKQEHIEQEKEQQKLQQQVQIMQSKNDELQSKNEMLQQQNHNIKQEHIEQEKEQQKLQQQNDELQTKNEMLQQQNETIESKNDELQSKNEMLQRQNHDIKQEHIEQEKEQQKLQQQVQIMQTKQDELQSKNEMLQRQNETIESKNDELIKENSILKKTIKKLKNTVSELKSKLTESYDNTAKLIKAYKDIRNEEQQEPEPEPQPEPQTEPKKRIVFEKEEPKKERKSNLFKR